MTTVGSIGLCTFFFILFALILILIIILFHKSKVGRIVFFSGLVVFIIVFAILGTSPTTDDPVETDIVDRWYVIVFFSLAIFIGLIVAIVAYLMVVLFYQDYSVVIPT